jgi:hypothetical protein
MERGPKEIDPEAFKIFNDAIAKSTSSTYATPIQLYKQWCINWNYDPNPLCITTTSTINWLTSIIIKNELMHKTLKVYRSAISSAWMNAGGQGTNPVQDPSVTRLIAGYGNRRYASDKLIRELREEITPLTAELLARIEPFAPGARGGTPQQIMMWACACFLTFGLNRCGEIFRSTRIDRPPLDASNVKFFDNQYSTIQMNLAPIDSNWKNFPIPALYSFPLGKTKADREGKNEEQKIAARVAVIANWRWAHIRRDLGGGITGPFFQVPSEKLLERQQLFDEVSRWYSAATNSSAKITGKSFRRGGNQSLIASGASIPDIQIAGRWKSASMPAVYSSASANSHRNLVMSQRLGELYKSAQSANKHHHH